jgi:hypothetical protein
MISEQSLAAARSLLNPYLSKDLGPDREAIIRAVARMRDDAN